MRISDSRALGKFGAFMARGLGGDRFDGNFVNAIQAVRRRVDLMRAARCSFAS